MLIQDQSILSDKEKGIKGNCLITTYACYFDLPVNNCPQIQHLFDCEEPYGFWDDVLALWLKQRGYEEIRYAGDKDPFQLGHSDYYFAWGMSPRGVYHQVIYKDGKLFHDPHPSRSGIISVEGYIVLQKINNN